MSGIFKNLIEEILKVLFGTGMMQDLSEILTQNPFQSAIESAAAGIEDVILPVASVLVCIYFMMALMDKVTSENFSTDQFIKLLLKLVLSIAILNNASELSRIICKFGTTFTQAIGSAVHANALGEINGIVGDLNFFEGLAVFIIMLIPFLFSLIVRLVAYFMVFGYILEIEVRSALAPIGFADFVTSGANSNGMRYLKKLLALSIQGGIMIIVLAAGQSMMAAMVHNFVDPDLLSFAEVKNLMTGFLEIAKILGVQIATVGILGSAKSIATDVIG